MEPEQKHPRESSNPTPLLLLLSFITVDDFLTFPEATHYIQQTLLFPALHLVMIAVAHLNIIHDIIIHCTLQPRNKHNTVFKTGTQLRT